jgi:hypothetical protein
MYVDIADIEGVIASGDFVASEDVAVGEAPWFVIVLVVNRVDSAGNQVRAVSADPGLDGEDWTLAIEVRRAG